MSVIRWEEPPQVTVGAHRRVAVPVAKAAVNDAWGHIAAALREQPGCWAVVHEGEQGQCSSIASRIRAGAWRSFVPAGAFDAVSRKGTEVTSVYARYVGGGES